jgi:hypothetical protein
MKFTKVKSGLYEHTLNGERYTLQKILPRVWYVIDSKDRNWGYGNTMKTAVESFERTLGRCR